MSNQKPISDAVETTREADENKSSWKPISTWKIYLRHLISCVIWVGGFSKLFVFDFDRWLVAKFFPSFLWLLNLRLVFFVAIIALICIFWSKQFLWRWVLYILFYPFIITFWDVPKLLYKHWSWELGISLIVLAEEFRRSFKTNILIISSIFIGSCICFFGNMNWLLIVGICLITFAFIVTIWKTIISAFRLPLEAFSKKTLDFLWKTIKDAYTPKEPSNISLTHMSEEQKSAYVNNLQGIIIYNRGCYFLADKLRLIKDSNLNVFLGFIRLVILFLGSVWTFFLLNWTFFRIYPSLYSVGEHTTAFTFLFYSFNALFTNTSGGIKPIAPASQALFMCGAMFMYLVYGIIIISVITSWKRSNDKRQMDSVIAAIQSHAESIEPYLSEQYGMTIIQAVEVLQNIPTALLSWIYYLSPSLRPNKPTDSS